MNYQKHKYIGIFLAIIFSALTVQAQLTPNVVRPEKIQTAKVEEHKLDSKLMQRKMPYQIILPSNYYEKSHIYKSFSVVYLLHGLEGHYNNWTSKTKLSEMSRQHQYILVFPEGGNGWYADSETVEHDKYESYIISELIPEVEKKFRAKNAREGRAIAGLSMGGYGALKFGLKYPEKFAVAGSFSGALRAAEWNAEGLGNGWKVLTNSITKTFGGMDSQTRKENNIFEILSKQTPETVRNLPFIYLDCGTEDFLIQQNRDFAGLLFEKKIPHEFRQLPGKHDWVYWNSQVEEFLDLSEKFLK